MQNFCFLTHFSFPQIEEEVICLLNFNETKIDEFLIYGDLNNERTEIDSELAFGFLKMGVTPIY